MMPLPLLTRAADEPDGWAVQSDAHGGATWSQFVDAALRLAAALQAQDLGDSRRVLVIARNRPATLLAHAAATLGEACSVPVNFHLTAGEIAYIAAESGARLAFVDSTKAAMVRQIPLGHVGAPEDIARAVLFLASDEARYITGTELVVDGGFLARW